MKRNTFRNNRLQEDAAVRARSARDKGHAERVKLATSFRHGLEAQYRASVGAPGGALSAAVEALLSAAVSAHVEIAVTTERFLQGRASSKSLTRLGLCRSELRRALRALNLADSGEAGAAPTGPTIEDLKAEYAAREAVGAAK